MGAYTFSGTAASNTTVDGLGAAGSDSPDLIDNLVRALAASDANLVKDLGGYNTVAGTADAITITLADASTISNYTDKLIGFVAGSDNATTSPTLNVDAVGAEPIKKAVAGVETALAAGDIQGGGYYLVRWRSTWDSAGGAWELLNPFETNVSYATQTLTAAQQSVSRTNISAALKGQIFGLTLSNNVTDATNDIDIAAGEAASTETNPVLMVLASALTKRLDAAWAVGTGNGGLDTGSIANTTYHIWLIQRSDTGVVDALFSTSATSPTMPSGYDRKRRIGSIIRASAAIVIFRQSGDVFERATPIVDRTSTAALSGTLLAVSVPTGIIVSPILNNFLHIASGNISVFVGAAASGGAGILLQQQILTGELDNGMFYLPQILTNTSAQIYYGVVITSGSITTNQLQTLGWVDTRGKDA